MTQPGPSTLSPLPSLPSLLPECFRGPLASPPDLVSRSPWPPPLRNPPEGMPLHNVHSMVPFPTHDPPSLRYLRDQMLSTSPPHALERPSYLATAMSEQGDLPSALGRSSSEPWRAPSTHPVRWTPPAAPRIPSTFQRLQQELWVCRDALQSPSPFIFTQGCQQFSRLLRRTLQSANEHVFYETLVALFHRLERAEHTPDLGPVRSVFEAALCDRCAPCWSPAHRQVIQRKHQEKHQFSETSPLWPGHRSPSPSLPSLRSLLDKKGQTLGENPTPMASSYPPRSTPEPLRGPPSSSSSTVSHKPTKRARTRSHGPSSVVKNERPGMGRGERSEGLSVRVPSPTSYPFLQFEGEYLLSPRPLGHSEKAFSLTWPFHVSADLYQHIQSPTGGPPMTMAIHLLVVERRSGKAGPSPAGLQYQVNGHALPVTGKGANTRYGFDMSVLCTQGANTLTVTAYQCCCNLEFAIRPVRSHMERIVQHVRERAEGNTSHSLLRQCLSSSSQEEDDVAPVRVSLSLRCPLSQSRLQTGVRGRECTHLQCFDLDSYLLWNRSTPSWRCPICQQRARWDDLVVEPLVQEILQQVKEEVEWVHLDPEGHWSVPDSPSPSSHPAPSPSSSSSDSGEDLPAALVFPSIIPSWTGKRRGESPPSDTLHLKKLPRVEPITLTWVDLTE